MDVDPRNPEITSSELKDKGATSVEENSIRSNVTPDLPNGDRLGPVETGQAAMLESQIGRKAIDGVQWANLKDMLANEDFHLRTLRGGRRQNSAVGDPYRPPRSLILARRDYSFSVALSGGGI